MKWRVLLLLALAPPAWADRTVKDAPRELASAVTIAPREEPGERLLLAATVANAEGKPVAGAIVYAYHTDAKGVYPDSRNPPLYGYARTDAAGRFTLDTIWPGAYPEGGNPAHIHVQIAAGGSDYRDECWFEGDAYLRKDTIEKERGRGRLSRIVKLEKVGGVWRGEWTVGLPRPKN